MIPLHVIAVACALLQSAAAPDDGDTAACVVPSDIQQQIDFYSQQAREDDRRYPALALLGQAHLKRAAWSGDAADVRAARDLARRSIDIQPNLAAYKVLAAAANYGHRFEDALPWCDRADAAAPGERQVLAMRTEALLGLQRLDDLERLLSKADTTEADFYVPACQAQLFAARGERAKSLETYRRVARLADAAKAADVALWARVAAAGVCLDSGHPEDAVPYMKEAEALSADDPDVIVHRAEYDEASGQPKAALAAYQILLTRQCNPELHRRAARLCRETGDTVRAAVHFNAAERLWRASLIQGEVSPLEGLSGLYCDAAVRLDEAVELAQQNLEHKRDASAREALARAKRLRDAP